MFIHRFEMLEARHRGSLAGRCLVVVERQRQRRWRRRRALAEQWRLLLTASPALYNRLHRCSDALVRLVEVLGCRLAGRLARGSRQEAGEGVQHANNIH